MYTRHTIRYLSIFSPHAFHVMEGRNVGISSLIIGSDEKYIVSPNNASKKITSLLQEQHRRKLLSLKSRGHSFYSLEKSPCSNFFIVNVQSSTSDSLVRFTIRARTNSLSTEANLRIWNMHETGHCSKCRNQTRLEILAHRLNYCRSRMKWITEMDN
jgi:hypothetical protein